MAVDFRRCVYRSFRLSVTYDRKYSIYLSLSAPIAASGAFATKSIIVDPLKVLLITPMTRQLANCHTHRTAVHVVESVIHADLSHGHKAIRQFRAAEKVQAVLTALPHYAATTQEVAMGASNTEAVEPPDSVAGLPGTGRLVQVEEEDDDEHSGSASDDESKGVDMTNIRTPAQSNSHPNRDRRGRARSAGPRGQEGETETRNSEPILSVNVQELKEPAPPQSSFKQHKMKIAARVHQSLSKPTQLKVVVPTVPANMPDVAEAEVMTTAPVAETPAPPSAAPTNPRQRAWLQAHQPAATKLSQEETEAVAAAEKAVAEAMQAERARRRAEAAKNLSEVSTTNLPEDWDEEAVHRAGRPPAATRGRGRGRRRGRGRGRGRGE